MPCYHPNHAYRHPSVTTKNGKSKIVITGKQRRAVNAPVEWLTIPCGQCIGCKITKSKEWAIRCVDEATLFGSDNMFITLTKNPENMPSNNCLQKLDFPNFMKRYRKHHKGLNAVDKEPLLDKDTGELHNQGVHYPIRYFHCGEYGEKGKRPHHHACIFNHRFDDLEPIVDKKGIKLYVSEKLEELWSKEITPEECRNYKDDTIFQRGNRYYTKLGFCSVGNVTADSAAYVARYCLKKLNGPEAWDHYLTDEGEIIEPEFVTMSRRPGLGSGYIKHNLKDAYPKDFLTVNGKKFKIPKYYDTIYDSCYPEEMALVKAKRKEKAEQLQQTPERLIQMEKCVSSRTKNLTRSYDDESTSL